ncbi:hypothetical protein I4100191B2_17200 [Clostridiales bacterium]
MAYSGVDTCGTNISYCGGWRYRKNHIVVSHNCGVKQWYNLYTGPAGIYP